MRTLKNKIKLPLLLLLILFIAACEKDAEEIEEITEIETEGFPKKEETQIWEELRVLREQVERNFGTYDLSPTGTRSKGYAYPYTGVNQYADGNCARYSPGQNDPYWLEDTYLDRSWYGLSDKILNSTSSGRYFSLKGNAASTPARSGIIQEIFSNAILKEGSNEDFYLINNDRYYQFVVHRLDGDIWTPVVEKRGKQFVNTSIEFDELVTKISKAYNSYVIPYKERDKWYVITTYGYVDAPNEGFWRYSTLPVFFYQFDRGF